MAVSPNSSTQEILDITFDLIAEHDISGVTVDMVAASAGVSKATIYRRWSSRDELLAEAMTRLRQVNTLPDTGSLRRDLAILLEELVRYLNGPGASRVLASFLNAAVRSPQLIELQRNISEDVRTAYAQVIQRGIGRGELCSDVNIRLMIDMLISPFLYQSIVEHRQARAADIEKVVEVLTGALQTGKSRP